MFNKRELEHIAYVLDYYTGVVVRDKRLKELDDLMIKVNEMLGDK